jgi:hypothetical protein
MAIVSRPERREPIDRREAPLVSTVYLTDQGLRHARCGAVLDFLRRRQGLELLFHCRACHEHISLTEYALTRIPHGAPISAPRGVDELFSAESPEDGESPLRS